MLYTCIGIGLIQFLKLKFQAVGTKKKKSSQFITFVQQMSVKRYENLLAVSRNSHKIF